MPLLKPSALVALAALGVGGAVYGASRAAPSWYDAAPLLAWVRPDARAGLAGALGVSHLEDLTLYDLDVAYDPQAASFTLAEDVWLTNTGPEPLPDVVFRVYANAAPPKTGPLVRFVSGACDDPRAAFTTPTASAIRVRPAAPIAPGGRLRCTLRLAGSLARIDSSRTTLLAQGLEGMTSMFGGGDAGGDYGILGTGDGIVSFGSFYPVLARRAAGAWETAEASTLGDLGSDRMASFRARLEIPARARLAVTGAVTGEQPIAGRPDRREVRVVAGAIRDFAFVFGDAMESATRDVRGTRVRSLYLAADRDAGARVLDVAARALDFYERRFGAYPYTELTVSEAAVVGGAGGVEFSGLATAASMFYRPMTGRAAPGAKADAGDDELTAMLAQLGGLGGLPGGPGGSGGSDRAPLGMRMTEGMLEFVVAHEVAHQWWHGLVGSDSRDHPFVDEALAQYSAILYLEDRYGAARARELGDANAKTSFQAMRLLGAPDAAADQPVARFASTMQYAGVVYGKAPYYYRAAREALGDARFFAALAGYVARQRFREAPPRALPDLFAQGAGDAGAAKLRALERRWLDEAHGDEDLGKLDLGATLGPLLGGAGGGADLDELFKALQGGGTGAPAPGAGGPTPKTGDPDVDKLLEQLGGGAP